MTDSKELAMAKILLWQILGDGQGSKEEWWSAQRPEIKEHWREIAGSVLYHYESTRVASASRGHA